jgi:hypothetical protein
VNKPTILIGITLGNEEQDEVSQIYIDVDRACRLLKDYDVRITFDCRHCVDRAPAIVDTYRNRDNRVRVLKRMMRLLERTEG